MNTTEIIRLFKDFERYDKYTRDYGINDNKLQRFNRYLSKMKCVIEELQQILEYNNIEMPDSDSASINEHEIKALTTATTFYFKLEKRQCSAPAC